MDPETTNHCLTINQKQSLLQIVEPYCSAKEKENYEEVISRVHKILTNNPLIKKITWKWANKLTAQDIVQLIKVLPYDLVSFCLSGTLGISYSQLEALVHKFKKLEHLGLYYEHNNELSSSLAWDYTYKTNISNSSKNFRQSQKWCHLINKNATKISQNVLTHLSPLLVNLSLRNIALGKSPKSFQIILGNCPNLKHLDIGLTQVTDDSFKEIPVNLINKFASSIQSLKLDCNMITRKTLETILPQLFTIETKNQYKIKLIDIGRTNIVNVLQNLYKIPSLLCLGLSYLQIGQQQILKAGQLSKVSKVEEIVLQYTEVSSRAIQSILNTNPCLVSLTLSSIQRPSAEKKTEIPTIQIPVDSKLKRINLNYNSYVVGPQCLQKLLKNAPNIENLNLSGTKITERNMLLLSQLAPKLKWLQISHLDCLDSLPQNMDKQQKSLPRIEILETIIDNLPDLQYLEAYSLLKSTEVDQFLKMHEFAQSKQNILTIVLDEKGPILIKKIQY